jgi:hypothetical protein
MQGNREGAMDQYRWLLKRNPDLAMDLLKSFHELSREMKTLERQRSGQRLTAK